MKEYAKLKTFHAKYHRILCKILTNHEMAPKQNDVVNVSFLSLNNNCISTNLCKNVQNK